MMVTVSTHLEPTEAHIMRCRLEAEGIKAFVAHEHHVGLNWFMATALGGAKVQVAEADAEAARQVVEAVEKGEYALPDDPESILKCPRCGTTNVHEETMGRRVALLSFGLLNVPVPFSRSRFRCVRCDFVGKEDEF
jgi:uncharacterized C2H2 Zn-finger protein